MRMAGVPDTEIQSHGRWTSDAYRQYFDEERSQDLRLQATRLLQQREQLQSNSSSGKATTSSSSSSKLKRKRGG